MSAAHTWFGRSITPGHEIYPYLLRDLVRRLLVFGPRAAIPINRISRCTRLRLTVSPSARSIAVIRRIPIGRGFLYLVAIIDWGEPRNGQTMNSASIRRISTGSARDVICR